MKQLLIAAAIAALAFMLAAREAPKPDWRAQGILYLDHSVNARLRAVPVQAVHLGEGFWSSRRRAATERGLPALLELLEEHGVVDNFRRLSGHKNVPRKGPLYTDADLYEWMEAAAWAIASNETPDIDKQRFRSEMESLSADIAAAQDPTGYLDTYYAGDKAHLRFADLAHSHEDYCLGHLIQAGIAYYRATGSRVLLDPAIKFANYVVENFGPAKRPFATGYPELEMALVELYRTTGDARYLDFTRYLFSGVERDRLKLKDSDIRYAFSGKPFTSRTEFEGHAVRALYAASGATDYLTETGDIAYKKTLDLLWNDLTLRKMYITGGVGARLSNEGFGDPYELPSQTAYAETCAAVANVMWNFRLLALTGDASYADLIERALYNAVNSGMSLSGTLYCFRNPLASNGEKLRNASYDPDCCPPNVERLFESLPGYVYSISRDGVYVNLYHTSQLDWRLEDGAALKLSQATNYPWSGDIKLTVEPAQKTRFTVYLRWPDWAPSAELLIDGQPVPLGDLQPGSYIPLTRDWSPGQTISLSFPMQPVQMVANPRVADVYGRIAMQRGPLIYALEQLDQNGAVLADAFVKPNSAVTVESKKDLLGGVVTLKLSGSVDEKSLAQEALYQPLSIAANRIRRPATLTFIPYYAIGNREPTPMEVWVPLSRFESGATPVSALAERHQENR